MTRKATASAPSNIAFIKYWGATDLDRVLPANPSLSMTLDVCRSTTTVEVHDDDGDDVLRIARDDGSLVSAPAPFHARFTHHLDLLRHRLDVRGRVEAVTRNGFPSDAGIASSASGFAALAWATSAAFDRMGDTREMSIRARISGSGSATRSVMGGYVGWPRPGDTEAAAYEIKDADHWRLHDVIALVETGPKDVSSLDGHRRAASSPHFARRQEILGARCERMRTAVLERDFATLAHALEEEAVELHLIAMSSSPPIFYWNAGTMDVIHAVRALRNDGVPCAFTMDAGSNVHVICPPDSVHGVTARLNAVPAVEGLIVDETGSGPRLENVSLF